jgi:hypothetical protein
MNAKTETNRGVESVRESLRALSMLLDWQRQLVQDAIEKLGRLRSGTGNPISRRGRRKPRGGRKGQAD